MGFDWVKKKEDLTAASFGCEDEMSETLLAGGSCDIDEDLSSSTSGDAFFA